MMYYVISKALSDMPKRTGNLNDPAFIDQVNLNLKQISPSGFGKSKSSKKFFTKKAIKKANKKGGAFAPYLITSGGGKKRSERNCILQLKDPAKGKAADYYSYSEPDSKPPSADDSDSDSDDGASLQIPRRGAHDHEAGPSAAS